MIKALDKWLVPCLTRPARPSVPVTDILLAICDHFEPFHRATPDQVEGRLDLWARQWPRVRRAFSSETEQAPRYSFFYPAEQYAPSVLERLASLCRETESEVEVHLHHDGDDEASLSAKLEQAKEDWKQHGLLGRDRLGEDRFGFIHGNWALDNARPDGRWCGVDTELRVLRKAGCYADFTLPSAPSDTQSRIVNRIYYARESGLSRDQDRGEPVHIRQRRKRADGGWEDPLEADPDRLLLIQGPLGLNWKRRKWGVLPRVENGDLTGENAPRPDRFRLWLRTGIHVEGRPEWVFIKLHTHGAVEKNSGMLLGEGFMGFLEWLSTWALEHPEIRLHFVTARQMANVVHAAREGREGNAGDFLNHWLMPGEGLR